MCTGISRLMLWSSEASIHLQQHCVRTSCVVTLHDFRYVEQLLHYILIHTSALQVESYVCACAIANALRIHFKAAAYDYATLYEVLYTLMNCST